MLTENPQAFSRENFICYFLWGGRKGGGEGEHYDMYYFFPVKENVKDIFSDGYRRQEQQKDFLKSIKKIKL